MNDHVHPIFARALAPFAPCVPASTSEQQAQEIDQATHQDKLADGYARRQQAQALRLQQQIPPATGFF